MNENEISIIENDITDLTPRSQSGGLLDNNIDDILYFAKRADEYMAGLKKIMTAALAITNELDWVLIGGKPYLQESGSSKIASLLGISIQLIGKPQVEVDSNGYKTFTYKARFIYGNRSVDCEGSRSASEEFFTGKDNPEKNKKKKTPDEIDERDVKMSAYTNLLNNGIKRIVPGLRNINVETLKSAGLDILKISGYTFKTGSQGGNSGKAEDSGIKCEMCGTAITQKVASYSQAQFGQALCMNCQKKAKSANSQKPKNSPNTDELPPINDEELHTNKVNYESGRY